MAKTVQNNGGVIQKTVLIQASPSVIYRALTEAKELTRWFCDRASADPRVGGELIACWKSGKTEQEGRAVYTQIVPDSLVELLWLDEGIGPECKQEANHRLSFRIREKHGTSQVVVHDEGDPAPDPETFDVMTEGWNSVLLELKDHCERKERSSKRKTAANAHG